MMITTTATIVNAGGKDAKRCAQVKPRTGGPTFLNVTARPMMIMA